MEDQIIITYDYTNSKDVTTLVVGRRKPNGIFSSDIKIVNIFFDDEAEYLYKKLTTVKGEPNELTNH